MERPSPSPVTTKTFRLGSDVAIPVAMAGARPWMPCTPYVSM